MKTQVLATRERCEYTSTVGEKILLVEVQFDETKK
jgi:hypothetical protein